MTRSTSADSNSARSRAWRAARTHIDAVVSCGAAMRLSRIPVRDRIHSSLVSTSNARSLLLRTRSGTYRPQPDIAAFGNMDGVPDTFRLPGRSLYFDSPGDTTLLFPYLLGNASREGRFRMRVMLGMMGNVG